ncbi:MAG TPA: hypothetical protein VGI22_21490 [Xanthobacteraceae bacterium]|jgi:hypothetical protein
MLTELPEMIARVQPGRGPGRRPFDEAAPIVAAILYLLLLAWNVASLAAAIDGPFGRDQSPGAYNPMEPSRRR